VDSKLVTSSARKHSMNRDDWMVFLNFADRQLGKPYPKAKTVGRKRCPSLTYGSGQERRSRGAGPPSGRSAPPATRTGKRLVESQRPPAHASLLKRAKTASPRDTRPSGSTKCTASRTAARISGNRSVTRASGRPGTRAVARRPLPAADPVTAEAAVAVIDHHRSGRRNDMT